MEMEPSAQLIAKKLWNIVRTMVYMLRKGISKSKLMVDLHMMLKRGKIATKAIGSLLFHHHHHYSSTSGSRSNNIHMSFVSPKEYEFSCSNSPAYHPSYFLKGRQHHHHRHHLPATFDTLSNQDAAATSPLAMFSGFEKSPVGRQLKVTDSPFSLKENEEDMAQVDKAAEEFIMKFYKQLRQQRIAVPDTPSPHHIWA